MLVRRDKVLVIKVTVMTISECRLFYNQRVLYVFPAYELTSLAPLAGWASAISLLRLAVTLKFFTLIIRALV